MAAEGTWSAVRKAFPMNELPPSLARRLTARPESRIAAGHFDKTDATPILLGVGAALLLTRRFSRAEGQFLVLLFVLPIVLHLVYYLGMAVDYWPVSTGDNTALGWSLITAFGALAVTIVYWLSLAVWLGILAARQCGQKAVFTAGVTLAALCALAALEYLLIVLFVFD